MGGAYDIKSSLVYFGGLWWAKGSKSRVLVVAFLVCSLAGCNCTVFSRSTACQATMAGEVVALAPAIAITRLGESMHERHEQHEQQSFRRQVLAGDLQAQARCVLLCAGYSRLDDGAQLLQRSAARVLAEWDANPPGEALPVLMVAHAYEARLLQKEQPRLAAQHWRRLAVLSTDPRVVPAIRSDTYDANGYDVDYYTRLAVEAQSELIKQSRLIGGGVADPPATGDACVPVAPWPPAWMATGHDAEASLQTACSLARPGVSQ